MSYALLVEQFEGAGHAAFAAGDERSPQEFRDMLDEALTADAGGSTGRFVSEEERELRTALGVG